MTNSVFFGSVIKPRRKDTRTVHLFGVDYVFADRNKDGHYIAEVTDPATIEHMANDPVNFYLYPPGAKLKLTRQAKKAAPATPPSQPQGEGDQSETPQAGASSPAADSQESEAAAPSWSPDHEKEAADLLELKISDIGKAIQRVSSMEVVHVAIAMEKAKQSPRANVVKMLQDTIDLSAQKS